MEKKWLGGLLVVSGILGLISVIAWQIDSNKKDTAIQENKAIIEKYREAVQKDIETIIDLKLALENQMRAFGNQVTYNSLLKKRLKENMGLFDKLIYRLDPPNGIPRKYWYCPGACLPLLGEIKNHRKITAIIIGEKERK